MACAPPDATETLDIIVLGERRVTTSRAQALAAAVTLCTLVPDLDPLDHFVKYQVLTQALRVTRYGEGRVLVPSMSRAQRARKDGGLPLP